MTQKIGLLGSDNSHAERFSEILNVEDHPSYWAGSGAHVRAIWGPDPERTAEAAANGQIPVVADSPEQVVAECDMVFVIPRDAGLHLEYAKPVISAGKPLFVDKPLTKTPDQARELISLARKAGIAFGEGIAAAGSIRYASYMGPAARNSLHGGILFYAIHTVELMQHFHGHDVTSIHAIESPPGADRSNVNITCTYANGTLVSLGLIGDGVYVFYMMAVGQEGIIEVPGTARNYAADAESRARAESARTQVARESKDKPRADHYELGIRQILGCYAGRVRASRMSRCCAVFSSARPSRRAFNGARRSTPAACSREARYSPTNTIRAGGAAAAGAASEGGEHGRRHPYQRA